MKVKKALPWGVLLLVVGFVAWKLRTSHFDWAGFGHSLRTADLRLIALAFFAVNLNQPLRAMRWAIFLRPALRATGRTVKWWELVGSQFIGFTGLSIFGRIGELIRPVLVARRTGLTFSSQVAVVAVERVFDLAAFGLIFALNLLFAPQLRSLPYLYKAGYFIGGLMVALIVFVAFVRLAGALAARLTGRVFGMISKPAGVAAEEKILAFQSGLNVIDTPGDLLVTALLSVALWLVIALAYVLVMKAFPPPVETLTPAHTIVLMGFSIAGSALPVPGGGGAWAGNTVALGLFGIPGELAASAGLLLWLVLNMSVVPFGLIYAQVEGISLRQMVRTSAAAEERIVSAG